MKKLLFAVLLITSSACAGINWNPRPPRPPQPATDYRLQVYGTEGSTITNDAQPSVFEPTWLGPDGAAWDLTRADFNICAEKEGYVKRCEPVPGPLHNQTIRIDLTPIPKPATAPRRSQDALKYVRANFCNLPTRDGKPMFTPFYISLDDAKRKQWLDEQRVAGSTHFVLSPSINYPGAPWPSTDFYGNAQRFVDFVQEVIDTPSADGYGFTPILILDPGDANPRPRIDDYWPKIAHELQARGLLADVIVVPGWELIKASDWSSADFAYGLNLLHRLGVPHIWAHLSSGRWSWGSNPVEPDDPLQGGESAAWKAPYDFVEGFLYETENLDQRRDSATCNPAADDCWRNRLTDGVIRMGNGVNGWRIMPFAVFETVAYGQWNGVNAPEYARDVASGADAICKQYNVVCGHGNGLPWGMEGTPAR